MGGLKSEDANHCLTGRHIFADWGPLGIQAVGSVRQLCGIVIGRRCVGVTDTLTPEARSRCMTRIRSKDSNPEMRLRRLIHCMGFRYRLHVKDLPGKPDLVFPGRRAVIFMHGCFWHQHQHCKIARLPKTSVSYWKNKLEGNIRRDIQNQRRLHELGLRVLVVWECELRDIDNTAQVVRSFLEKQVGATGRQSTELFAKESRS
ncbi:MAG: DNA mismatch endonuclease Vsr [Ectothiorhodospiraceae bacterium]|nr:DNA mismatch endonuclease Vsr [Ectothiorhodospiraceae bacterium]